MSNAKASSASHDDSTICPPKFRERWESEERIVPVLRALPDFAEFPWEVEATPRPRVHSWTDESDVVSSAPELPDADDASEPTVECEPSYEALRLLPSIEADVGALPTSAEVAPDARAEAPSESAPIPPVEEPLVPLTLVAEPMLPSFWATRWYALWVFVATLGLAAMLYAWFASPRSG